MVQRTGSCKRPAGAYPVLYIHFRHSLCISRTPRIATPNHIDSRSATMHSLRRAQRNRLSESSGRLIPRGSVSSTQRPSRIGTHPSLIDLLELPAFAAVVPPAAPPVGRVLAQPFRRVHIQHRLSASSTARSMCRTPSQSEVARQLPDASTLTIHAEMREGRPIAMSRTAWTLPCAGRGSP